MINEGQRIKTAPGLAESKRQLQARGFESGKLYSRLEDLGKSLDSDFDYQLAKSILRDLPTESASHRKLGSTEPDGYKTLRDVLNEIVTANGPDEKTAVMTHHSDKSSVDS